MNHVYNVESYEVFAMLSAGIEVYAINEKDCCIDLKYESVDTVLRYIHDDQYAFFYVRWGEE